MSNRRVTGFLVSVALLWVSGSLFAHHGNAAYDNKTVTVKGTVTAWVWTNPHTFLKFDAKDEKGNVVHWLGEWNAPSTLINFGITAKSFKAGEEVTVTMTGMSKTGQPVGRVTKVILPMDKSSAWVASAEGENFEMSNRFVAAAILVTVLAFPALTRAQTTDRRESGKNIHRDGWTESSLQRRRIRSQSPRPFAT